MSPSSGEAQDIRFYTILSEIPENHLCILHYLAPAAALQLMQLTLAAATKAAYHTPPFFMSLGTRASWSPASRQRAELEADYSSDGLSVCLSVLSVRPPPWGSSKHIVFASYCLKFQKLIYVFYDT